MNMGLIIERHPSDIMKTAKIKVVIDKKLKYQLWPGEKVEVDVSDGLHKVDCSLNLIKGRTEINYPTDTRLIISYRYPPIGIDIQRVSSIGHDSAVLVDSFYCGPSAMNGGVGELTVTQKELIFRGIGGETQLFDYTDIRTAGRTLNNLVVCLYSGQSYTFVLPKDRSESVLTIVHNKVADSFAKLHEGFELCFGETAHIYVRESDESFYMQDGEWVSQIYNLSQIINYGIDTVSAKQDFFGDAALGSMIDGTRGALLGALHATQRGNKVESIKMNLTVKTDNDVVAFCLNFSNPVFSMEKGSEKYNAAMMQCSRFIAYMDDYSRKRSAANSNVMPQKANESLGIDVVEELKRYKALLDDGIITSDEFEAKKKHLLNISQF